MNEALIYEQRDHVVVLTLNDPDTRNALNGEPVYAAFEAAARRVNADYSVRCVVLTGQGSTFCSGGNVNAMRNREGMFGGEPHALATQYRNGIQRVARAMHQIEVPTIAAVNGPAIGAGCGLACICDIRVASARATFAESFVKLGIVPGDGSAWSLPRIVGYSKAAEMSFTGDSLDAGAAVQCGLVSKVVDPENLMDHVMKLAARIGANPPHVVRWTKRMLREGQTASLQAMLDMAAAYQGLAHHTADHREALAALAEKRVPVFRGG